MKRPTECPECGEQDDFRPMRNLRDPEDRTIYGHECGYCGAHLTPGGNHSAEDVRRFNEKRQAARDRRLFG